MNKQTVLLSVAAILVVAGGSFVVSGMSGWGPGDELSPATDDEVAGMLYMREEEKLARDSYLVMGELWSAVVFDNIAVSEQQHMDAMKSLLVKFDVPDPVFDESDIGAFSNPEIQQLFDDWMARGDDSLMEALGVGAAIEETDIRDISESIAIAVQQDIITTYESLLCGSRNHLRSFVGQIELRGIVYEAQVISQAEVDAIVDTPTERSCGGNRRGGRRG